jgi:hypothetical protein
MRAALDADHTGVYADQIKHRLDQRRLTATIHPDQAKKLTLFYLKVNPVQHDFTGISFYHFFAFDHHDLAHKKRAPWALLDFIPVEYNNISN